MKTITVNIAKQTVTINNETCNFIEAGLITNADPVQPLTDRNEIEEVLNEQYSDGEAFEIFFKTIIVDPADYEIFSFASGYFGICEKGSHGGNCVKGGDSANHDDYNEEYMKDELDRWDGPLYYTGGKYGYKIDE